MVPLTRYSARLVPKNPSRGPEHAASQNPAAKDKTVTIFLTILLLFPQPGQVHSLLGLKRLIKRNRKGRKGDTKFAKKTLFFVSFA
jgi:hypothetical protein